MLRCHVADMAVECISLFLCVSLSTSPRRIFILIVVAQFCGTSTWFAGNAILPQLQAQYQWAESSLAYLTSSTQLGFIFGTLAFAILGVTDKFSPSRIFFISSLIASVFNAMMLFDTSSFALVLASRFLVGVSLAGIYPVGMKIAADWNEGGLGHWLGALVGALVLGTAFPHSLKAISDFPDITVFISIVSALCAMGGFIINAFVPDGPFRKPVTIFSFSGITRSFQFTEFRTAALGYFGHMWELYAMWAFIPGMFMYYSQLHNIDVNASALAFVAIGAGSIGCFLGGLISKTLSSSTVAIAALLASGICCIVSPWVWHLPLIPFISFMIFWGMTMAADSPQLSALVARNAPAEVRGSAITIIICIGFAITIISIQLISLLSKYVSLEYVFLMLAPGPLIGAMTMWNASRRFKPQTI